MSSLGERVFFSPYLSSRRHIIRTRPPIFAVQYIKIFRTSSRALRRLARQQQRQLQEAHLAGMRQPREEVAEVGTEEEEKEKKEAVAVIKFRRPRCVGAAAETDIRIRRTASG